MGRINDENAVLADRWQQLFYEIVKKKCRGCSGFPPRRAMARKSSMGAAWQPAAGIFSRRQRELRRSARRRIFGARAKKVRGARDKNARKGKGRGEIVAVRA